MGNRLTKTGGTSYTYGDADQMTAAGGVSYTYDTRGNQTGRSSDTFQWDHENRMKQITIGGATSSYTYNGDGVRMSRTTGGNTTNYVWDVAAGLPVILQDGTNTYVYGLGLISTYDGTNMTYRVTDGLGSTINLCDQNGNVLVTYAYDAFGGIRSQQGTSNNPWLFTGEQRDSESGYDYLRARYYDPAVGRFLGEDPLGSGYAYVANNPANLVDPTGLSEVCTDFREGLCAGTTTIADEFDAFYILAANIEFWVPPQVAEPSFAPSDVIFNQAVSAATADPTCYSCYDPGDYAGMGIPPIQGPYPGPCCAADYNGQGQVGESAARKVFPDIEPGCPANNFGLPCLGFLDIIPDGVAECIANVSQTLAENGLLLKYSKQSGGKIPEELEPLLNSYDVASALDACGVD